MYCKNCGAKVDAADKFCTSCGTNLGDKSFSHQPSQPTSPAPSGVSLALCNAFSSTQFLIACICLSAAIFAQMFLVQDSLVLGDDGNYSLLAHIAPIVCVVFLWILFANSKKGNATAISSHLRVFKALARFQYIITWITVVALILLWLILAESQNTFGDFDTIETITEIFSISLFLGSYYNVFILFLGLSISAVLFLDTDNILSLSYSLCSDDGIVFLIVSLLIMCVVNTVVTKNLYKTVCSLLDTLSNGYPPSQKTGFAKTALLIMAAIMVAPILLMGGSLSAASIITFLAYGGFMIAMGLSMSRLDYELSNVK